MYLKPQLVVKTNRLVHVQERKDPMKEAKIIPIQSALV
jgi:hypothetical protein